MNAIALNNLKIEEMSLEEAEQVNGGRVKARAAIAGFAAGGLFGAALAVGAVLVIEYALS
ncbi:class IIb bacteriocin, lactobin A/cerein 7B family [Pseudoalteromonas sp. JC3]|uniref:class IIb bacteriocin, lactobin A/cerein 7B family n=1 Tax=Pseudoalteromonas sp. JC3 TaxID=2810196 RepID=UPI0019D1CE10|nr:class IIb bacteriocin, lactobin A/cerein 7B family [Pseudoalteromonas sp. JC3]MBR8842599.1 class IIb bacteriocin, lactobin A/cerein 7B family [Pseudoalteromonas sp. JC3]WJE10074.1 class IIb bacteriocin, lactobin A/cerein 7B family [Pseudoalteromonas sp. JC3]